MHNASKITNQTGTSLPFIAATTAVSRKKAKKLTYYIDIIQFKNGNVVFDYTLNDEWLSANINFNKLVAFAEENFDWGLPSDCLSKMSPYDLAAYAVEFIDEVALAYLKANKFGQSVN